jgi:hypothetical protein
MGSQKQNVDIRFIPRGGGEGFRHCSGTGITLPYTTTNLVTSPDLFYGSVEMVLFSSSNEHVKSEETKESTVAGVRKCANP